MLTGVNAGSEYFTAGSIFYRSRFRSGTDAARLDGNVQLDEDGLQTYRAVAQDTLPILVTAVRKMPSIR